jgi:hypothetical protein
MTPKTFDEIAVPGRPLGHHHRYCPSKAIPIQGLCDHWGVRHSLDRSKTRLRMGTRWGRSPESHYAPQLAWVGRVAANEFESQANLAKLGCLCAKRFCNALWSTGFCKTGAFAYLLVKACGPYPVMNANGTFFELRMSATG